MNTVDNRKKQFIVKDRWHWDGEWDALCEIIANHIASAETDPILREKFSKEFYAILASGKFSPNTPTWINAGRVARGTLSGCFVRDIDDTMESILEASYWTGMVQKFGGGTGFNLSKLRAKGVPIKSTHGKACGPIRVLRYLAATSRMITQGGARDGANMAVMSVYHPDIMEFIHIKQQESEYLLIIPRAIAQQKIDDGSWTKDQGDAFINYCSSVAVFQLFNVSVTVDRAFMDAVVEYIAWKPVHGDPPLVAGPDRSFKQQLPCGSTIADVWDAIVKQAHASGDPGLLFIERAQAFGALHSPLELPATNPCGEQYLPNNGSCNLGSIDLAKFVSWNKDKSPWQDLVNWDELRDVIRLSVRFLDDVVTVNHMPMPEIHEVNQQERRLGLGIMGWADFLIKVGVSYDSPDALEIAADVSNFFQLESQRASVELATEKGPFPLWEQVKETKLDLTKLGYLPTKICPMPAAPRRNATITTVAPTGTISIVAGCSSGIEPHFMSVYEHKGMADHGGLGLIFASETIEELHRALCRYKASFGVPNGGPTLEDFDEYLRNELGWKPANEIAIEWHVKHQAIWQQSIDNSISKTLNLPNSTTPFQVEQTYLMAWNLGCKGTTIYRDGCKPVQVLNAPQKPVSAATEPVLAALPQEIIDKLKPEDSIITFTQTVAKKMPRPEKVPGWTWKIETSEGDLWVTITYDEIGMPFEIFAGLGKGGSSAGGYTEAISRVVSIALRHRIPPIQVIRQLRGIKTTPNGFGGNQVLSVPDGIGIALEKYMADTFGDDWGRDDGWMAPKQADLPLNYEQPAPIHTTTQMSEGCPTCGVQLHHAEGCKGGTCFVCGFTRCS